MEGTFNLVWTGETTSVMPMLQDRKSGSAGMPRPISYAVFCLEKKASGGRHRPARPAGGGGAPPRRHTALRAGVRGGVCGACRASGYRGGLVGGSVFLFF